MENAMAHDLFNGYYEQTGREWLRWECNLAMENPDSIWDFHTPGNWRENQFTASQVNKYLIQEAGLKIYFSNVYTGGNDIDKVN